MIRTQKKKIHLKNNYSLFLSGTLCYSPCCLISCDHKGWGASCGWVSVQQVAVNIYVCSFFSTPSGTVLNWMLL